jgi:hypothetical protein
MHYVVLARTAALHIGERGFLPIRRGKIPIAGASLVIVPASPLPDRRRAPVIHAHLQQGAGRNPHPGPNRTAVKSAQRKRSARGDGLQKCHARSVRSPHFHLRRFVARRPRVRNRNPPAAGLNRSLQLEASGSHIRPCNLLHQEFADRRRRQTQTSCCSVLAA